jgi:ribose-phosphate pyrophosphokinase
MTDQPLVLGFPDYAEQSRRLAEALQAPWEPVGVHRFPDGESKVTLPPAVARHVILCRSLDRPNDKLIELILAAATARRLGARELTLVAPYLCYMRQDAEFHPGEAVSQRIIGGLLAEHFEGVITVDPHLHRTPRLAEAVPTRRALALSAATAIGEFLAGRVTRPFLLGPDGESAQWVRAVAEPGGLDYAVAQKQRLSDHDVQITLPAADMRGREVVLIDDVASTGRTLAAAAEQAYAAGAAAVHVLVTHALLVGDAWARLERAGVRGFWSTDSVAHASNVIELAPLLASSVRP